MSNPLRVTTDQELLSASGGGNGARGLATNAANLTDMWAILENNAPGQDLVVLRLDP